MDSNLEEISKICGIKKYKDSQKLSKKIIDFLTKQKEDVIDMDDDEIKIVEEKRPEETNVKEEFIIDAIKCGSEIRNNSLNSKRQLDLLYDMKTRVIADNNVIRLNTGDAYDINDLVYYLYSNDCKNINPKETDDKLWNTSDEKTNILSHPKLHKHILSQYLQYYENIRDNIRRNPEEFKLIGSTTSKKDLKCLENLNPIFLSLYVSNYDLQEAIRRKDIQQIQKIYNKYNKIINC